MSSKARDLLTNTTTCMQVPMRDAAELQVDTTYRILPESRAQELVSLAVMVA